MQKIFDAQQLQELDKITLNKLNISSHALMEKAAGAFVRQFYEFCNKTNESILILCGTGNNGGDGLAIARILQSFGNPNISVLIFRSGRKESSDFLLNLKLLENVPVAIKSWNGGEMPVISQNIIIDALVGIGLNRSLEGELLRLVKYVNGLNKHVIAVDVPTGMPSDGIVKPNYPVLMAKQTITFQHPKLSFFFPESAEALEQFVVVEIGLDKESIMRSPSDYSLLEKSDVLKIYRKRSPFSHKGTYGKALIIAADTGTIGAALLCSEACLQAGAGLTTACMPESSEVALNIRSPEIMFLKEEEIIHKWDQFTAVAIGPGLGTRSHLLKTILSLESKPMVIDADGLNFLAKNKELLSALPQKTILTPHMKELDRLFGKADTWMARVLAAKEKAKKYQCIIVLKNRYTFIVLPSGEVRINPVGNPAMASGGMGDVLSGIITAFLAQGYTSEEAAILGCYMHGRAGDILLEEGMAVIPASILAAKIPFVINEMTKTE